jgi:hypothetical protein
LHLLHYIVRKPVERLYLSDSEDSQACVCRHLPCLRRTDAVKQLICEILIRKVLMRKVPFRKVNAHLNPDTAAANGGV